MLNLQPQSRERSWSGPTRVLLTLAGLGLVVACMQTTYDLTSPQNAWTACLKALATGRPQEVKKVTTPRGYQSLERILADSPWMKSISVTWGGWEVRWIAPTSQNAQAYMGPVVKEHGLSFILTSEGWKLDQWTAGQ